MEGIGTLLALLGYVLRSGHASGADEAFERGAASVNPTRTEIYLPWKDFRKNDGIDGVNYFTLNPKAFSFARSQLMDREILPKFDKLNDDTKAFHARNVFQVYGMKLKKSDFVVYCAERGPDGKVFGGTRTAVELAESLQVPTYNLRNKAEAAEFADYLFILCEGAFEGSYTLVRDLIKVLL